MAGTSYADFTPDKLSEARRYKMEIFWSDEDDAYLAYFPDAPGVVTHGSTAAEAAMQGEGAIITLVDCAA